MCDLWENTQANGEQTEQFFLIRLSIWKRVPQLISVHFCLTSSLLCSFPLTQRAVNQSPESLWCRATPASAALCPSPASQRKRQRCPSSKPLITKASAPWTRLASPSPSARWGQRAQRCTHWSAAGCLLTQFCCLGHVIGLTRGYYFQLSAAFEPIVNAFSLPHPHYLSLSLSRSLCTSHKDELSEDELCFSTASSAYACLLSLLSLFVPVWFHNPFSGRCV